MRIEAEKSLAGCSMNRGMMEGRKRLRRAALLVILFALTLALPVRVQAQNGATPAFREVTDETGRVVKLPRTVRRIVSLAPSLTETVYALGLQDRLVGDTDYCDYPVDASKKHKVGGAINPNMEEVAALKPDVVLVVKSLNRLETVHALQLLGIAVYSTDPHTVQDVLASMKRLSTVLGSEAAGSEVYEKLESRLAMTRKKLEKATPRKVMFVVWTE